MRACPYLCPQMADSVEERRKEEGEVTTFFLKTESLFCCWPHVYTHSVNSAWPRSAAATSERGSGQPEPKLYSSHLPPPPSITLPSTFLHLLSLLGQPPPRPLSTWQARTHTGTRRHARTTPGPQPPSTPEELGGVTPPSFHTHPGATLLWLF